MGKTVFITGASSGFGKACVSIFAKNNWDLLLSARRVDRLKDLQDEFGQITNVHIMPFDIRIKEDVHNAILNVPEEFKEIDLLINNAGLALGLEPAYKSDIKDWEIMVDTNIKGLMYCTRFILPNMMKRNKGHIINIGSVAGNWPYPGGNVYGATKAFVKQFSLNLRADVSGTKIRITNIEPGLAETEFSIIRYKGDVEQANSVYEGTKPLTADDIADILFWVANSPEHININRIEVMPVCQSWGPFSVEKDSDE